MVARMRRLRSLVLAALIMAAAPGLVTARVRLPSPEGRSVYGLAGVISPEDVRTMEGWHQEPFNKTGVALVVVTVRRLEGEPIEDFAIRVGSEWGVGKKGEDRGIVVALSA